MSHLPGPKQIKQHKQIGVGRGGCGGWGDGGDAGDGADVGNGYGERGYGEGNKTPKWS